MTCLVCRDVARARTFESLEAAERVADRISRDNPSGPFLQACFWPKAAPGRDWTIRALADFGPPTGFLA